MIKKCDVIDPIIARKRLPDWGSPQGELRRLKMAGSSRIHQLHSGDVGCPLKDQLSGHHQLLRFQSVPLSPAHLRPQCPGILQCSLISYDRVIVVQPSDSWFDDRSVTLWCDG